MLGTFYPGDRLVIEPTPFSQIKRGDIIVFTPTSAANGRKKFLVHRVLTKNPVGLVTAGDHNLFPDQERVTAIQLIGKVTHLIR